MTALKKRYSAYTLLEMMIVMAIFIIISLIGFSAFYGLKDSITLNEETISLEQDIRYAQRAALFTERDANDRWLYGIGIDFSQVESTGKYNLFKWCSSFDDYGDPKTTGTLPNYSSGTLGPVNGNVPVAAYTYGDCPKGSAIHQFKKLENTGDMSISKNFTIDLPASNNAVGDVANTNPVYLLFEAVSGRAFFYDSTGVLTNYATDGSVVGTPINFRLDISSSRTKTMKSIIISNISGKVKIVKSEIF